MTRGHRPESAGKSPTGLHPTSTGSTRAKTSRPTATRTRLISMVRARRPGGCFRESIRRCPTRSTPTGSSRTPRSTPTAPRRLRFIRTTSRSEQLPMGYEIRRWRTAARNLRRAFLQATADLQADQADVEHGLYIPAPACASRCGPGCNNGSSTCANGTGTHGYLFSYDNGGTSGYPSVIFPPTQIF